METITRKQAIIKWIKKLGFWGFMFFLIKGLIWLVLAWWIAK